LSGVRCRLIVYGPADAAASPNPIISCLIYIQDGLPFWYRLAQVVLEYRLPVGCSNNNVICVVIYQLRYITVA